MTLQNSSIMHDKQKTEPVQTQSKKNDGNRTQLLIALAVLLASAAAFVFAMLPTNNESPAPQTKKVSATEGADSTQKESAELSAGTTGIQEWADEGVNWADTCLASHGSKGGDPGV